MGEEDGESGMKATICDRCKETYTEPHVVAEFRLPWMNAFSSSTTDVTRHVCNWCLPRVGTQIRMLFEECKGEGNVQRKGK